jgi:hypothetical protein
LGCFPEEYPLYFAWQHNFHYCRNIKGSLQHPGGMRRQDAPQSALTARCQKRHRVRRGRPKRLAVRLSSFRIFICLTPAQALSPGAEDTTTRNRRTGKAEARSQKLFQVKLFAPALYTGPGPWC